MKIFLDTNIIFSAILFSDSTPEKALIKALEGDYEVFTCTYVLNELIRVVSKKIPILNSALFCKCGILITADKDFLEARLTAIKAITASEFLYKY